MTQWQIEYFKSAGTCFGLEVSEKLHSEQSPYQKIEVFETKALGKLLTLDDCFMVSTKDNYFYHEMITHPAILAHHAPKNIAIIGGGDCGTLKECLKHKDVEKVTQIDIDERVTRVSELFFPELCDQNKDERAHLLFQDGVQWIKDQQDESIDILIIDSTDPVGFAEALFKEAFQRDCLTKMAPGGIIIQQSESPVLHIDTVISPLHNSLQAAGFSSPKTLGFPQPVYPSGYWSVTMAIKGQADWKNHRCTDETANQLNTNYYSIDIHNSSFAGTPLLQKLYK